MIAAESSFSVCLSGERMLRTQTSPCGSVQSACARSCSPRNSCTRSPLALMPLCLRRASCFERLRAPRAVMPKIRVDAPTAVRAACGAPRKLPRAFGLDTAPRTVAHEWHQRPVALLILAVRAVALVSEAPRRLDLEPGAVAPGAIVPVGFHAAVATRAIGGVPAAMAVERRLGTAPWAALHQLRDRARAVAAAIARFDRFTVLAPELPEQHRLPQRRIVGLTLARVSLLLGGAVAQTLELAIHRDAVRVPVLRANLDRMPQPVRELRADLLAHAFHFRRRPVVRPFGQIAREKLIDNQA